MVSMFALLPLVTPSEAYLGEEVGGPEGMAGGLLQQLHSEVAHPLGPVLLGAALAALPRPPQGLVIHRQLLHPTPHCTHTLHHQHPSIHMMQQG